jgi:hypothetical protein
MNPRFIAIRYQNGRWNADRVLDRPIIRQLRKEAGVSDLWPDNPDKVYDALLSAAGEHGLGLETEEQP